MTNRLGVARFTGLDGFERRALVGVGRVETRGLSIQRGPQFTGYGCPGRQGDGRDISAKGRADQAAASTLGRCDRPCSDTAPDGQRH